MTIVCEKFVRRVFGWFSPFVICSKNVFIDFWYLHFSSVLFRRINILSFLSFFRWSTYFHIVFSSESLEYSNTLFVKVNFLVLVSFSSSFFLLLFEKKPDFCILSSFWLRFVSFTRKSTNKKLCFFGLNENFWLYLEFLSKTLV